MTNDEIRRYDKAVRCLPSPFLRFTERTKTSKDLGLLRWTILEYWNEHEAEYSNKELYQLLCWLDDHGGKVDMNAVKQARTQQLVKI